LNFVVAVVERGVEALERTTHLKRGKLKGEQGVK
jgi:hypothetical protein